MKELLMHANLPALAALMVSVILFALAYPALRKQPVRIRLAVGLICGVLSPPSLLFAAYYLHVVPERAWFYELHAVRGAEFLLVFVAASAAALAACLPRVLVVLPLFGLIALGTIPYLKPLLAPLSDRDLADHWKGPACLQSTSSTCGPASVSTILAALGAAASEREAARAAYSYGGGTEAWYLARYVRQKGFRAHFDFCPTFDPSVGLPALVGVHIGGVGHFIAVLSASPQEIVFADPLGGEERVTPEQFRKRYHFTGFHMPISRPGS